MILFVWNANYWLGRIRAAQNPEEGGKILLKSISEKYAFLSDRRKVLAKCFLWIRPFFINSDPTSASSGRNLQVENNKLWRARFAQLFRILEFGAQNNLTLWCKRGFFGGGDVMMIGTFAIEIPLSVAHEEMQVELCLL